LKDDPPTIYFGPKFPEGKESNWVQIMPNKGYNVLLLPYEPEQDWFDKTRRPGDFEVLEE